SRHSRRWSADSRGPLWFCADALAMAWALQPDGALEVGERPVVVELDGRHARGMTLVDWQRQTGAADNARILAGYDQERFEALARDALAAG
ncbi:MAG: nucleoside hydrolase, partial [Luteimonas sp.]